MIFLFLLHFPAGSDFQWPFPERNEFPFHPNVLGNWINSRCLWIQEPRKILSIWPAHKIKVIWQNTLLILIFPIYLSVYLSYILYLYHPSISSIYLSIYIIYLPIYVSILYSLLRSIGVMKRANMLFLQIHMSMINIYKIYK